ncbi:MAG TPA: hypothetical protein VMZ92_00380 [Planctomycetota bacterium]|nr:hypothetical protein [Planctomycetota bacterium]
MRKLLPFLVAAGVGLALLLLPAGRTARAQSAADREADSLLERIRSAKSRQQATTSAKPDDKKIDLNAPGEGKTDKEGTEKDESKAPRRREAVEVITDPYEYMRRMGTMPRAGTRDLLRSYDIERTPNELLERIRESRVTDDRAKKKATERKETALRRTSQQPSTTDYRQGLSDYNLEDKYLSPLSELSDGIGADALRAPASPREAAAELRRSTSPTDLPDPNKNLDRYQKGLREQYGEKGALPQYVDTNLRGTYEAGRFKSWLQNEYGTRVETDQLDVSQLNNAYREFQALPPVNESLGRRDSYIPNSQNFLSDVYRGTIYSQSNTIDPGRRNWSPSFSQSKYSTADYYNLNTFDSYSDYYEREYGVSKAFVPGSSARHYDINTMKQWEDSLRRDYGMDSRAGDRTYADLYRLYTSKPGY